MVAVHVRGILCPLFNGGVGARWWFTDDRRCNGRHWCDRPNDYNKRVRVRRIWAVAAPAIQSVCYFFIKNPVWMLTISGTIGAMMMPLVAGNTIYLRYFRTDRRIAPGRKSDAVLWACFLAMIGLAIYAIYLQFTKPA